MRIVTYNNKYSLYIHWYARTPPAGYVQEHMRHNMWNKMNIRVPCAIHTNAGDTLRRKRRHTWNYIESPEFTYNNIKAVTCPNFFEWNEVFNGREGVRGEGGREGGGSAEVGDLRVIEWPPSRRVHIRRVWCRWNRGAPQRFTCAFIFKNAPYNTM